MKNNALNLLLIKKRENTMMEAYAPGIEMLPIQKIVKGHLVIEQYTNEKLTPATIESVSLKITETIDAFLKKSFKEKR